jgi:hypothetical protein
MPKYKPKKGEEKWNMGLCEKVIEHMSKGYSLDSFTGEAKVTSDMLYKWRNKYPEFDEACKIGSGMSRKVWENLGIQGSMGKIKNFSAATWIFTMKCRFGYRDGSETGFQSESKAESAKIYKTTWKRLETKAKQEING